MQGPPHPIRTLADDKQLDYGEFFAATPARNNWTISIVPYRTSTLHRSA